MIIKFMNKIYYPLPTAICSKLRALISKEKSSSFHDESEVTETFDAFTVELCDIFIVAYI